jgi:uncharacterized protein
VVGEGRRGRLNKEQWMSEPGGFQHGVPCWVATWQPDAAAAARFYTELLGWQVDSSTDGQRLTCRRRDRRVAAIAAPPPDGVPSMWCTYIWVDDLDATAAKVSAAGGNVLVEPFDSPDGGRMAIAADPSGAIFGLWQTGALMAAELVNEPGAWTWAQLLTSDAAGSQRFYTDVFGWTTDTFGEGAAAITMFRVPGFVGGLPTQPVSRDVVAGMAALKDRDQRPFWRVDFWVDDVDDAAATAARLGGTVVTPPVSSSISRDAVLTDPAGVLFSITKVIVTG